MEASHKALGGTWQALGRSPSDELLQLTFAVKQRGLQELHATLMRVSDPVSPEYGMHLSNDEVQALTAPDPLHVELVMDFLRQHGVQAQAVTPNSDFITALVSVETAEKLLHTEYVQHSHPEMPESPPVSRALGGYSLPAEVAAIVDFVAPTVHLPPVRQLPKKLPFSNQTDPDAMGFNTPKNLRKLYNVASAEGVAAGNKQAVTAFLDQKFSSASLKAFWRMYCGGIHCGKGDPKLVGDETTGRAGIEAMLDIETITGLAGNVESEFWGFSGRAAGQNEPFMKWLVQMSNTADADVPKIFSSSYGEDESAWSLEAAQRLNVEFQKAGVRGITLLFAAGDEGANCKAGAFAPEWPSSSPYVTAVGGTAPAGGWPSPGGEKAAGLSSGGFSNRWQMPSYQQEAVAAYLKQSGLPDRKFGYNVSGRSYPDLAAQAENFIVFAGGPQPGVAGTSCASPAAAALFSLLNDLRLQSGTSSLGFLNPLIYKNAAGFNDITTGSSNGGCSFSSGWPARPGWDAVTGVGTPDYAKLAKVVAGLPSGTRRAVAGQNIVV